MNPSRTSSWAAASALFIAPALLLGCAIPLPPPEGAAASQPSLSYPFPAQQAPGPSLGAAPSSTAALLGDASFPLHLQRRLVLGRVTATTVSSPSPAASSDALAQAHLAQALVATNQFSVEVRPDLDFHATQGTTAGVPGTDGVQDPGTAPAAPAVDSSAFSLGVPAGRSQVTLAGVDALLVGRIETWPAPSQSSATAPELSAGMSATARFVLRALDPRSGESIVALSAQREAPTREEALARAATEVARALAARLAELPWQAYLLQVDGDRVRLSAGEAQGLRPGMALEVQTLGDRVRSRRSGVLISLPGQRVARLRVDGNASARLVQGSLAGLDLRALVVRLPATEAPAGFSERPDSVPRPPLVPPSLSPQPTRTSP